MSYKRPLALVVVKVCFWLSFVIFLLSAVLIVLIGLLGTFLSQGGN